MCSYGNYRILNIRESSICIDDCIFDEIELLNTKGIKTLGCCCGHGEYLPSVLVDEKSVGKMLKARYVYNKIIEYKNKPVSGVHEFILKTGCRNEADIKEWNKNHKGLFVFKGFREGFKML